MPEGGELDGRCLIFGQVFVSAAKNGPVSRSVEPQGLQCTGGGKQADESAPVSRDHTDEFQAEVQKTKIVKCDPGNMMKPAVG